MTDRTFMRNMFGDITPKQVGQEWLADLRSGQYEQGSGRLKQTIVEDDSDGATETFYCCLGVLVETVMRLCPTVAQAYRDEWERHDKIGALSLGLPDFIGDYVNLDRDGNRREWERFGNIVPFDPASAGVIDAKPTSLAAINDHYRLSFAQIADIVEAELLPTLRGQVSA